MCIAVPVKIAVCEWRPPARGAGDADKSLVAIDQLLSPAVSSCCAVKAGELLSNGFFRVSLHPTPLQINSKYFCVWIVQQPFSISLLTDGLHVYKHVHYFLYLWVSLCFHSFLYLFLFSCFHYVFWASFFSFFSAVLYFFFLSVLCLSSLSFFASSSAI